MSEKIRSYRDLRVWQESENLFDMMCEDSAKFPKNDSIVWTIKDQVVRSIGSVGANIAEGFARQTKKEFIQFLNISRGSTAESEVWVNRMKKQKIISDERYKIYEEKLTAVAK
ncbi:four helix bundle protein, partial [Patescibacteria group bacterium]|nr:four helix bundle protein [Patescibacteria group bacterium]